VFNFAVRISIAISFAFFALVSVGCTNTSPKGAVAPQQYAEFPGDDSAEGSPGANSKAKTEVDKLETMAESE
jgi:hypothetical protein